MLRSINVMLRNDWRTSDISVLDVCVILDEVKSRYGFGVTVLGFGLEVVIVFCDKRQNEVLSEKYEKFKKKLRKQVEGGKSLEEALLDEYRRSKKKIEDKELELFKEAIKIHDNKLAEELAGS